MPITAALYTLTRARAAIASLVAMLIGIVGILLFTVVQAILVFRSMEWAIYYVVIGVATLMIGAWIIITGCRLRRSTGPLHRSLIVSILGATYFGYPIWAIWVAWLLVADKLTTAATTEFS